MKKLLEMELMMIKVLSGCFIVWVIFVITMFFSMEKANSTTASDIDTIRTVSLSLKLDADNLMVFAQQLQQYNLNGFVFSVDGTTQTVTLTPQQKQGLIAQYQNIKSQMQSDFQQLP